MNEKALRFALGALLVLGGAAIYAQTAGFSYLRLDDGQYTYMCPFVMGGLTWENVWTAFGREFSWGGIWMPLTSVSYMAVVSAFGNAPGPQHVAGAALHLVNAALFYWLLLRLLRRRGREGHGAAALAFGAAALWAWHPLRVESVAWVASRKDALFTLFTLAGLLAWERGRWCGGYLAMALACLCKPTAMCFPFLAFAVERLAETGAETPRVRWRGLVKYVPLLGLAAATGLLATYSQSHGLGGEIELYSGTLWWRLLNAAVSTGLHLFHLVCPVGLTCFYRPIPEGMPLQAALGLSALVAAAAVFAFAWWRARGARSVLFLTALWFAASLGPTLGIAASFGHQAYADRFTYVPMMAFSLLAVFLVPRRWTKAVALALCVVAGGYGVMAGRYAGTFRDDLAAFRRVAECDPENAKAHQAIGAALLAQEGSVDEAIDCFRRAIRLDPAGKAGIDLIYALHRRGRPEDREESWRLTEPFREDPSLDEDGLVLDLLATEAYKHGEVGEAKRFLKAMTKVRNWQFAERAKGFLRAIEEKEKGNADK